MKKEILILTITVLCFFSTDSFADKIYIKGGKILEGKIMQISSDPLFEQECDSADSVIIGNQCVEKSQIEKIEKVFNEPQGAALLAQEDQWGPEKNGYRYQLIPANQVYIFGQPMYFHLIVQNVSKELKWYQHGKVDNDTLLIKDSKGREIIYKIGSFQVSGVKEPIDEGEIITVFQNRDISGQYLITKPGFYTIQYRGGSNILELDIRPAFEASKDVLISSLSGILPNIEEDKLVNSSDQEDESKKESLAETATNLTNPTKNRPSQEKNHDPSNIIEYLSQENGENYVYITNNSGGSWIGLIKEALSSRGLKLDIKTIIFIFIGVVFIIFIFFKSANKSK